VPLTATLTPLVRLKTSCVGRLTSNCAIGLRLSMTAGKPVDDSQTFRHRS
jgi:hypothetical protein